MIGVAVGVLVIVAGTVGLLIGRGSPAPRRTVAAPTHDIVRDPTARPTPTAVRPGVLQPSYQAPGAAGTGPVAMPVSLTIPAIGVQAKLISLGLTSTGSLNVAPLDGQPQALDDAGWYTGSVRPGAIGPAVIAGHINWSPGQGVFENLIDLRPGDAIYVKRADNSTVKFVVTRVQTTLKTDFPAGGVFGATPDAELRVITCGDGSASDYDSQTHHYLSNTIVYATEA